MDAKIYDNPVLQVEAGSTTPTGIPAVKIGVVITTAGAMDYMVGAVESFLQVSPANLSILVIDDASKNWTFDWQHKLTIPEWATVNAVRFEERGGLHRSCSCGLKLLLPLCDFVAVSNDDVLVPHEWWQSMVAACTSSGYDFVGPLSNAPGMTNREQYLNVWDPSLIPDNTQASVDAITQKLKKGSGTVREGPINGFFIFGSSPAWQRVAYDNEQVFPSRIEIMPSGHTNPHPNITGGEDWLAARCRKLGMKMGISLGSYVFHFRSVTRGKRYVTPGWSRKSKTTDRY